MPAWAPRKRHKRPGVLKTRGSPRSGASSWAARSPLGWGRPHNTHQGPEGPAGSARRRPEHWAPGTLCSSLSSKPLATSTTSLQTLHQAQGEVRGRRGAGRLSLHQRDPKSCPCPTGELTTLRDKRRLGAAHAQEEASLCLLPGGRRWGKAEVQGKPQRWNFI